MRGKHVRLTNASLPDVTYSAAALRTSAALQGPGGPEFVERLSHTGTNACWRPPGGTGVREQGRWEQEMKVRELGEREYVGGRMQ